MARPISLILFLLYLLLSGEGFHVQSFLRKVTSEGRGFSINLTCYQCIRYDNEECTAEELVTCSPNFDRCVTHIERGEKHGYMVKRECGLGPCAFEDDMVNKGLGLDGCDRSKQELFCVSCCRTSGCNKNSASVRFFFSRQTIILPPILILYIGLY